MLKKSRKTHFLLAPVALAAGMACCPAWAQEHEPWPTAQLAAPGYTGAINTPTADTLPWGSAGLAWSNSNPERARKKSPGSFGSLNAGFGLLPGLELVGRLAFDGDLHCSMFVKSCASEQRDLSVSGKYQLPLELPLDTRLALGFTDYGGAATAYRQVYGVATSTWGPLDLSLGYSRPQSSTALMNGAFGSLVMRVDEHWSTAVEHDTRAARLGVQYRRPITPDLALQLGASRKLSDTGVQQAWQLSAALNIALGRMPDVAAMPQATPGAAGTAAMPQMPRESAAALPSVAAQASTTVVDLADAKRGDAMAAETLAQALEAQGFAQISVRYWPATSTQPALWQVNAEPRRWRQNQLDALGMGLSTWLKTFGAGVADTPDELQLTLTYQRQPVLHAYTSARCLDGWARRGGASCALMPLEPADSLGRALLLSRTADWPEPVRSHLLARVSEPADSAAVQEASVDGGPFWMPQFEIGPSLRTAVGTEVGLVDYSLSMELGAEVNLAPGLFWQGVVSAPVSNSTNYDNGHPFGDLRHPNPGIDSGLLTYWQPLPYGLVGQASAGYIDRRYKGGVADALWMSEDGRWRLSGTAGSFEHDVTGQHSNPVLGGARWSLVPGTWQLEATAGRFLSGDVGYNLASKHWFGDTLFKLHYQESKGDAGTSVAAQRKFLGFTLSLPIGPKQAHALGSSSVRGSDRFVWGLQTKIRDRDNAITRGYGERPQVRHGVQSDVTDYDRNGRADLLANSNRLRELLTQ